MASNGSKNMEPMPLLNYYLTMNIKNICRICLETSDKLTSIFDPIKSPHFSILTFRWVRKCSIFKALFVILLTYIQIDLVDTTDINSPANVGNDIYYF